MSSSNPSWFLSESLRAQFSQDIIDALAANRINVQQSRRLESLCADPDNSATTKPRADQFLRDAGGLIVAELAGALLISDDADVYLHTALYGLERFDNRQQLISEITLRLALPVGELAQLQYQHIEGELFEPLTLAIMDQRARQLQPFAEGLQRMPGLHEALGRTLQQRLDALMPGTTINVFSHLSQIRQVTSATLTDATLGSQTLAEMAMHACANQPLPAGLRHQWLDGEGRELSEDQARPWQQALAGVTGELTGVYEKLLADYWNTPGGGGMSRRDLARQAVTECFRQHLLQSRHEAALSALEFGALKSLFLPGEGWAGELRMLRLSLQVGSQAPVKLAGIFLIDFTADQLPDLFLYSAEKGLRRFADPTALAAHLTGIDERAHLLRHASLNDHALLGMSGALHLRLDRVDSKPFSNLAESIIGLQKRNLAEVLKSAFTSPAQAVSKVDDALDIRRVLDPRLSAAHDTVHWGAALANAERSWSAFSSPATIAGLRITIDKAVSEVATRPWATYLQDARAQVERIFQARPGVADCAHTLLNRYFSLFQGDAIDARHLWFRDDDDKVVSLAVLLMERVSGHRPASVSQDCTVQFDPVDSGYSRSLLWLTPELLNHVMNRAQQDFAQAYPGQVRAFYTGQSRRVIPANAGSVIREGLLRLELNMQRNSSAVSDQGLDMLQQALDRPTLRLRAAFGFEATEVSIPALIYDSSRPAVLLSNVLVLQQPLSGAGKPLLWSAVLGVQEFDSLSELQLELNARLAYPGSRERWLELVAQPEREELRSFLKQGDTQRMSVNLARVEDNFLERLESDELNRQYRLVEPTCQLALDWQVGAGLFEDMLTAMGLDAKTRNLIDMLSGKLETTLLTGGIPAWLKGAPVDELLLFRQLLVRFRQLYTSRQDIESVATLEEYATDQLAQNLHEDFPDVLLDPQQISITLTRYTGAPGGTGYVPPAIAATTTVVSESLSRYAINRFANAQDGTLSVSSDDATVLPEAIDADYVRELVHTLDVGVGYQQYLKQTFSETAADYADRHAQFVRQAPSALLLTALSLKLQGKLSSSAFAFIENIFNMPDGVARLPVDGQNLLFSPLKLVCAEGYAADLVTGVFLITPKDQAQGPWILHAVADATFAFKEYAGQSEFLTDLCTSLELQAMVLERLDPTVRFVYERGGFLQPHLSWATGGFNDLGTLAGPTQVRIEPLPENALHSLFRASLQVMLIIAQAFSVTNAEADSAESRFLLLLGTEQLLMFLPGKLGGLVGLWQAQDLLHSSLDSAAEDKWGAAIAKFVSALAVLITARQQVEEEAVSQLEQPADTRDEAAPRWHDPQLQLELGGRLQAFEVHDVSLSDLQRDDAQNIFMNTVSFKQYAAVCGKVYQVTSDARSWYVVGAGKDGPRIKLDADKRWTFDTDLGSRRDGGALTRLKTNLADSDVNDILLVQARGMPEVQRLYPQKALQITEAHAKARQYLENALNNLTVATPQSPLDPRTASIIKDFFGVDSLGNVSVIPIKQALADVYRLLMDPSFSPHSSDRYVVGAGKLGYEDCTAFNFSTDPLHRVFLSDRFFVAPYARLKPRHMRQGSFNAGTHFRASILIHELSHIANGTHDIAYVDSTAPYLDLLEDNGTYRARLKREQQRAQYGLSHRTPRDELFRLDNDGTFQDLKTADGDAKQAVLKVTGTDNLEAARDKFLHDIRIRSKVILSNADSVALLATLLGRERFMPAPEQVDHIG